VLSSSRVSRVKAIVQEKKGKHAIFQVDYHLVSTNIYIICFINLLSPSQWHTKGEDGAYARMKEV
jgi:hypothetical protein